ncbi:hypothetical protein WA158_002940 [Blastocystis sp. Blastoise]
MDTYNISLKDSCMSLQSSLKWYTESIKLVLSYLESTYSMSLRYINSSCELLNKDILYNLDICNDSKKHTIIHNIDQKNQIKKQSDTLRDSRDSHDVSMSNMDSNDISKVTFKMNDQEYVFDFNIINSYQGSLFYDEMMKNDIHEESVVYIDNSKENWCIPIIVDYMENKKISIENYKYEKLLKLIECIEWLNLPLPAELMFIRERRDTKKKYYNEIEDIYIFINEKEDDPLIHYLIENKLLMPFIEHYNNGYVDYDNKNDVCYIRKTYKYLQYMHEFCTTGTLVIPKEQLKLIHRKEFEEEMSVFGDKISNCLNTLFNPSLENSWILEKGMENYLYDWLGKEKKWTLLFRASEHDYSAEEFHKYCDTKGETITLVQYKSKNNSYYIFGGYTSVDWNPNTRDLLGYKYDANAFLFTLSNKYDITPTRYPILNPNLAIFCNIHKGPQFGGSPLDKKDMAICDQCHINPNNHINCISYDHKNSDFKNNIFVTTNQNDQCNDFIVEEYEVYGVIQ